MSWAPLPSSRPYHWPLSGQWSAQDTALLIIDMQQDFLSPHGYFAQMGYSLASTQAAIEPTRSLLAGAREEGMLVIYTRESHRPDLMAQGIRNLLLCGVTTDVCVHSTLREANDLGYDCLLVEDCCGAGNAELHQASIKMMMNEGGIFGAVAKQDDLIKLWRRA